MPGGRNINNLNNVNNYHQFSPFNNLHNNHRQPQCQLPKCSNLSIVYAKQLRQLIRIFLSLFTLIIEKNKFKCFLKWHFNITFVCLYSLFSVAQFGNGHFCIPVHTATFSPPTIHRSTYPCNPGWTTHR